MKFSKDLLELRQKEAKLVKMKRYEEAEKVKMKADLLEEFERNKLEAEVILIGVISCIDVSDHWEEGSKVETSVTACSSCSPQANPKRQKRTT